MRCRVAQSLANGHALSVQRRRHTPDRRLGPFVVDVPMIEMLDRAGIHHDEWRMNDRSGVHQRRRQGVLDRLDRSREGPRDAVDGMVLQACGKDARRQARGPRRDRDLVGSMLATEPGKRPRLADRDLRGAARSAQRLHHQVAAEGAGRQEDHLTVPQVRRERLGKIALSEGGRRRYDQVGIGHRRTDIVRNRIDGDQATALEVLQIESAGGARDLQGLGIATPQPDRSTAERDVDRRRVRAVASPENSNIHKEILSLPFANNVVAVPGRIQTLCKYIEIHKSVGGSLSASMSGAMSGALFDLGGGYRRVRRFTPPRAVFPTARRRRAATDRYDPSAPAPG